MSELQVGLLAIGALVVAGVLAYNRFQERGVRRDAEQTFRSGHSDVLLGASGAGLEPMPRAPGSAPRPEPATAGSLPDARIDYVVNLALARPATAAILELWTGIERRHARRALLAVSPDGGSCQAGLQLVSRDGVVGEADLIEFRSALETLAASVGATVSAPEMRAAIEAARELDDFCAEADIQVVVHVVAPSGGPFPGTKLRAAAEGAGLALEQDGKFALRNGEQRLVYTLGARDGSPFSAATLPDAAPQALTLALDLARTPDTRRSFEAMARCAHHLVSVLGGSIVDDNGNVLDERAVAAIAQQLETVRSKLEARGLPPGSPTALRLFS